MRTFYLRGRTSGLLGSLKGKWLSQGQAVEVCLRGFV